MAVSEQERHALHNKLEEVFGVREAATMIELLPPVGWGDIATRRDLEQQSAITRAEVAEFRAESRSEIAEFRAEFRVDIASVRAQASEFRAEARADIAEVRAEVAQLRGEMHRSMARMTWTMMIGMFATVIAAASFAFTAGVAL